MIQIANTDEAAAWSGPSGQSWIAFEAEQDRLLSEALEQVALYAAPEPGQRVLDVGCGTGALSLAASEAVGPNGRVLATDISGPLLDRAAERLAVYSHASTFLGDAQVSEWPETGFDMAISRFGVMFFADPPRAFANIARALKPEGCMVFATWAPVADNAYWRDPARIAMDRLGEVPPSDPRAPGPMGMADVEWSLAQLRSSGLSNVACKPIDISLPVDGNAHDAATLALKIGPAARVVRLFDASMDDRRAIHAAIAEIMTEFVDENVVRIPARINLYTAMNR